MNRRPRLRVLTGLRSESDPRSASGSRPKPLVVVVTGEEACHRRSCAGPDGCVVRIRWTARAQVLGVAATSSRAFCGLSAPRSSNVPRQVALISAEAIRPDQASTCAESQPARWIEAWLPGECTG